MGTSRALVMRHLHTDEQVLANYWRNGRYDSGACSAINHFLRDWRTEDVTKIDLNTIDIIHRVCQRVGIPTLEPVEIICGYRSPKTNAMLRRNSSGVAKNSYHLTGQAIDFRLPRLSLQETYQNAVALQAGGVGLYSGSDFVHVDTGPVRNWGI